MEPYATYAEFTQVYSWRGVSESEISSYWLQYGALRVNEALGHFYTTPFSSNNVTAKDLNIHFAALGILIRTRKQEDSAELKKELEQRISDITSGGKYMILDDGTTIVPNENINSPWGQTADYKPVFDLRDAEEQRIDPDRLDYVWSEDS